MATFSLLTDSDKAELWSCLALRYTQGLGVHGANALITHYGSAFEAVELGRRAPGCWVSDGLVSKRTATAFSREKWRDKAGEEWKRLQTPGCEFLFRTHPSYPSLLAEIHDAPLILYYKGDMRLLSNPMIGVVGSRRCSEEGILSCATLARQLASFGVTIVSGLAKGIDRAAHVASLSGLGSSIAVLGTGIDVVYPESNADVFAVLEERGLILSEFMPGTGPYAKNFPIRNRIISGLSRGVLIVEAAKRSGSLITARLALEQGRDVFAIPGSTVGKYSEGCHELIRSGAKPVFSAEDIILDLAPLLSLDVDKELTRLRMLEVPRTVDGLSSLLHDESLLPPLLEKKSAQQGYSYRQSPSPQNNFSDNMKAHEKGYKGEQVSPKGTSVLHSGEPLAKNITQRRSSASLGSAPQLAKSKHATDGNKYMVEEGGSSVATDFTPKGSWVEDNRLLTTAAASPLAQESLTSAEEPLSGLEQQVLAFLQDDWCHIEQLSEQLDVDIACMSTTLTLLEVAGLVMQKPGMFYRLARSV